MEWFLQGLTFHTVDPAVLLKRSEAGVGIRGCALHWFRLLLMAWTQRLAMEDQLPSVWDLSYGVLQGAA